MLYNKEKVSEEIQNAPAGSKVYFGCDSRRYKRKNGEWWISYTNVIVIHLAEAHGCRVFGIVEKERDYSGSMKLRLVREAQKAVEMVLAHEDDIILGDVEYEVHLDVNSDDKFKSNVVLKEVFGYVIGMTGVEPLFKPDAFAASCAADVFEYKEPKKHISRRKVRAYLSRTHEKEKVRATG